jgi:uncharacterized protein (DUF1684 family)
MNTSEYETEIERWRATLDTTLRKKNSWLALAGFYRLKEGRNTFGAHPDNDVILSGPDAPAHFGTLQLTEGRLNLEIPDNLPATIDGQATKAANLHTDINGSPSVIEYGNFRWIVIERGDQFAIRLWDNNRPERVRYSGRRWYPVDPDYRVPGIFTPHDTQFLLSLPSADGDHQEIPARGYVTFMVSGKECRLEALEGPAGGLFLIFKDLTNGESTYEAGRYLTTPIPEQDIVVLDFNRAYNPPCAFTDFATCALSPAQNYLEVQIEAGEVYVGLPEADG